MSFNGSLLHQKNKYNELVCQKLYSTELAVPDMG